MWTKERSITGTVSFLIGAAIGTGLALLFAPHSGKETQSKLKKAFRKAQNQIKENYEQVNDALKQGIAQVKNLAGDVKETVNEETNEAKRVKTYK